MLLFSSLLFIVFSNLVPIASVISPVTFCHELEEEEPQNAYPMYKTRVSHSRYCFDMRRKTYQSIITGWNIHICCSSNTVTQESLPLSSATATSPAEGSAFKSGFQLSHLVLELSPDVTVLTESTRQPSPPHFRLLQNYVGQEWFDGGQSAQEFGNIYWRD